jgi:hypothetical protein
LLLTRCPSSPSSIKMAGHVKKAYGKHDNLVAKHGKDLKFVVTCMD